jgi:cyanate permease
MRWPGGRSLRSWPCSAGWRFVGNCLAHRIRPALPRVAIIGQRRAWTLGLYFGLINAGYASLIAWLPPYYIQLGDSAQYSGSLLALLTVGQTAGRCCSRRWLARMIGASFFCLRWRYS